MPGASCRSRQGWLKNTTLRRPVPSPTCAVTIALRVRVWRFTTERTVTSTSAFAGAQVAHLGLVRAVDPTAGIRGEQVEDAVDTDVVEGVELLRSNASQSIDAEIGQLAERDRCRHSTPNK